MPLSTIRPNLGRCPETNTEKAKPERSGSSRTPPGQACPQSCFGRMCRRSKLDDIYRSAAACLAQGRLVLQDCSDKPSNTVYIDNLVHAIYVRWKHLGISRTGARFA